MPSPLDYALYLVISQDACQGRDPVQIIEQAVQGGVTMVQLREKETSTRDFVHLARKVKTLLDRYHIPLIINDRVDVALAVDASGVHVGQEDMHPKDVRPLLGPDRLLGLSVNSQAHLDQALTLPVDYLGIGPVFGTLTKKDPKPTLGIDGFQALCRQTSLPVVGIGGINNENAHQVIAAGGSGVALVSAICGSQSPYQAALELKKRVQAERF